MMKVLLATDGSDASRDAEWLLERIPFTPPIDLTIIHVEVVPSLAHLKHEFRSSAEAILQQYHQHAGQILEKEVARLEGMSGTVKGELRHGYPADCVIELAGELDCDLIVVGASGQTGTVKFLLGSTSAAIAKHAPCSVLVTRPSESVKQSNRAFRIVIAVDESEASRQAVEMLTKIPWGDGVEILVVNLIQNDLRRRAWDAELRQAVDELEKSQSAELVHAAVHRLRTATSRVSGETLRTDNVAEELLRTLDRIDADLVVLGHRGMSRIKRLFLGSTCERILRHANCSVWIHKEDES